MSKSAKSFSLHFLLHRFALKAGYRHIDCAKIYLNEKEVGEVFGQTIGKDIQREEIFIVGKVYCNISFDKNIIIPRTGKSTFLTAFRVVNSGNCFYMGKFGLKYFSKLIKGNIKPARFTFSIFWPRQSLLTLFKALISPEPYYGKQIF